MIVYCRSTRFRTADADNTDRQVYEYRGKVEQHVVTPGYAGVTEFKTYRKAVRKLSINRTPALSLRLGRAAV
jgi:hypothetical protein